MTPDGDDIGWRELIRQRAKSPRSAEIQIRLLERLITELGVVPTPPSSGTRPYLNLYPPARFQQTRIGNLAIPSARFYAVCDRGRLEHHLLAVPEAEIAERKYLAVYLRDDDDLEVASRMLTCAFEDRESVDGPDPKRSTRRRRRTRSTDEAIGPSAPRDSGSPEREPKGRIGGAAGQPSVPGSGEPAADKALERMRERVTDEHRCMAEAALRSYQHPEQAAGGRALPDRQRVRALIELLASRGGVASFEAVGFYVGMPSVRVPGFVASAARMLSLDGTSPLQLDHDAREVRLDMAVIELRNDQQ